MPSRTLSRLISASLSRLPSDLPQRPTFHILQNNFNGFGLGNVYGKQQRSLTCSQDPTKSTFTHTLSHSHSYFVLSTTTETPNHGVCLSLSANTITPLAMANVFTFTIPPPQPRNSSNGICFSKKKKKNAIKTMF